MLELKRLEFSPALSSQCSHRSRQFKPSIQSIEHFVSDVFTDK